MLTPVMDKGGASWFGQSLILGFLQYQGWE
jgi:hypothetical protein